VTTLVVDNYDSFTWNLVQLIGALGVRPVVVRNDELTLGGVRALAPSRVVLSPGPGHPADPARIGISEAILRELAPAGLPVLGVCLGHQAIVHVYGGLIVRGAPVHGKTSPVEHDGDAMFEGVPRVFQAMRYHSLVADPASLPPSLRVTAWCKDGTVMAVRHTRFPVVGVQFHPESIGTPTGPQVVETFVRHGVRT
jgi:anthranilate synthase/aminodeoxychorismate synthase-like glutamine amidotransferase